MLAISQAVSGINKKEGIMTRWFAWFQVNDRTEASFRVIIADNLNTAEMMATDLATRDKVILIGIIVASEQFNPVEKD